VRIIMGEQAAEDFFSSLLNTSALTSSELGMITRGIAMVKLVLCAKRKTGNYARGI
jgi:hypothetical protein